MRGGDGEDDNSAKVGGKRMGRAQEDVGEPHMWGGQWCAGSRQVRGQYEAVT